MICLLSPRPEQAEKFARSHFLARKEYFWANCIEHIKGYEAFHVLVIAPFDNTPYFERLLAEAQMRGMRNRR